MEFLLASLSNFCGVRNANRPIRFRVPTCVTMLDDKTPPSRDLKSVYFEDFAQIGAGTCLAPGVKFGVNSLVGAGSVVTKNVAEYRCVVGNPARLVKDVRDMKLDKGNPAYPWTCCFYRGMPWEGVGY